MVMEWKKESSDRTAVCGAEAVCWKTWPQALNVCTCQTSGMVIASLRCGSCCPAWIRDGVEEWNRAAAYIMGTECAYPDSAKAREALVAFSREKAENGIYRSREEWYGNR